MRQKFRISGIVIFFMISAIIMHSCKKHAPPTVTTTLVSEITQTTAISGGNVTNTGDLDIVERGVCWNVSAYPTIEYYRTIVGGGSGSFTSELTQLTPNTMYYVRAYATNSEGIGYGNNLFFTTQIETVYDLDGNLYHVVTIGTQNWMVENLKTTKYRNGDIIGTTTPATLDISGEISPKYQWSYDGNEYYVPDYGRLYTWYAVTDSRKVCPIGWHVPSDEEWTTLVNYYGGASTAASDLKEAGTTHWLTNTGASNLSGFTALPGGSRYSSYNGLFGAIGYTGFWWSSTEYSAVYAWSPGMNSNNIYSSYVTRDAQNKMEGFSVRCIKDN